MWFLCVNRCTHRAANIELQTRLVLSGAQSALQTARWLPHTHTHTLPSAVTSPDTFSPPAHMACVKSGNTVKPVTALAQPFHSISSLWVRIITQTKMHQSKKINKINGIHQSNFYFQMICQGGGYHQMSWSLWQGVQESVWPLLIYKYGAVTFTEELKKCAFCPPPRPQAPWFLCQNNSFSSFSSRRLVSMHKRSWGALHCTICG